MALAKLNEAERAKEEMENELKRKEQELQKRTGARFHTSRLTGAQDGVRMNVSHRGLGAFPRTEMVLPRKADGNSHRLQADQQVSAVQDAVACAQSSAASAVDAESSVCLPGTEPTKTTDKDKMPTAEIPEDRRPADDGQSGQGAVACAESSAPSTIEVGCYPCPPGTEPSEKMDKDKTPNDETLENRRPADDGQSEQDAVPCTESSAPSTVEAESSPCPPDSEPAETMDKDKTPTEEIPEDRRPADDAQFEQDVGSTAPSIAEAERSPCPAGSEPGETTDKDKTPNDETPEDRLPDKDGQSVQNAVLCAESTAQGTVESEYSFCSPGMEPAETTDDTPTDETPEDRQPADDVGQSDEQASDENKVESDNDSAPQQHQQQSSASNIN